MNKSKTQRRPDAYEQMQEDDDENRRVSARLAIVEAQQIMLGAAQSEILLQMLTAQQQENELSRDLAQSSTSKLAQMLEDIEAKRALLLRQKVAAKTPTEVLLLDMMDDTLLQRFERARTDLERAEEVLRNKSAAVHKSSQKIEAIKQNAHPLPLEAQGPVGKKWLGERATRVVDVLSIALVYAVIQQIILPLLNAAFGSP